MKKSILVLFTGLLTACSTIVSSVSSTNVDVRGATGTYMLPRTIFGVNISSTKDGKTLTVTRSAEGDPQAIRNFKITPSAFSNDVVTVEQSESLLTKVSSDATDQTSTIVLNLAELVFTTATRGAALPSAMRSLPAGPAGTSTSFTGSYDPLDPVEAASVREGLLENGFCILVGAETQLQPGAACDAGYSALRDVRISAASAYESHVSGIWFRRTIPTPVRIYQRTAKANPWKILFSGNESMFDKTSLYQLEIDRALFVEKKIDVLFENGSVKSVSINQPSTLAAATALPIKLARIIFAIPLSGLQQDATLTAARANLFNQQAALVKAQREYLALGVSATSDSSRALILNEQLHSDLNDPTRSLTPGRVLTSNNRYQFVCTDESSLSEADCAKILSNDQP